VRTARLSEAHLKYETHLKSLLAYVAKSSRKPIDGLYDLAWGSLALKEMGMDYEYFLTNIQSAVSMIASSSELADVLYDYRRAVGLSLAIYLFGARRAGFPEERLNELCNVLTQILKDRKIELAELIGASFLLAKHLKRSDAEEDLKSIIMKIKESCLKNPAYYLTDMLFIMFFLALAREGEFLIEALEDIRQNRSWMAYINEDPERMALLLYVLSKAAYSRNVKAELAEWCRTESNRIAEELYYALERRRLLDPQSYVELIDALLGVAEGFDAHVKQKFGLLIKMGEGDEIIINRKAIMPLPRIDLLAKAYIALCEAGYIRPFMLSKREADAYRQIQAELKGYRRIRKYELFFIMVTSALSIPLIFLTLALMLTNNEIFYPSLILLVAIIIGSYQHIWKRGYVSLRELLEVLREKANSIIEIFMRVFMR